MNIFVLDNDIKKCAQFHCDQHVVKMILESVQLLCTALNKKGYTTPYRSTHINHPCVLWVESSYDNFIWLVRLANRLNDEYRYRYNKERDHASMAILRQIENISYERCGRTPFAQAMPDQYKMEGNAVQAYRNFYRGEKMNFATWTRRPVPGWIKDRV
jgi:choline dehydrogenase-like flavoprotein